MQMRKTRQVVAGSGLLMFAAIITIASTLWTSWIQINSTTVVRLIVVLGIGAIACFLFWLLTKDQASTTNHTSLPSTGQKVDAPPTSNAASYGNIVNVFPHALAPAPPPQAVAAQPNGDRIPDLSLKVGWGTVEQDSGKFEFSEAGGQRAYIVEVINNPASPLGVAYPARSIVARITFKCGVRNLFIDRAYWVGREENEITLDVGSTAQILVGVLKGTQWTLYGNPTAHLIYSDWMVVFKEPVVREFPDMGTEPIEIDIHIISMENRLASRTLVHKHILVEFEGGASLKQITTRVL
jgi:hypothetical protein